MPVPVDWSLSQVWNAVALKPERPLVKRDYVYASELGQPMCDRVLKMNAVPMTNPPNARSRRKFLAGNIIEFVVKQILVAAGLYAKDEVKVDAETYKGLLDVHGRCDFKTINGYIDQGASLSRLTELSFPQEIYDIGKGIIESLNGVYLLGKILEIKSISSFGMDKVEKSRTAIPAHSLQAYHYQKFGGMIANICYICKDDMRMRQFALDTTKCEELYYEDIKQITHWYKKKKTPPIEPLAKFDYLMGQFSKNLGVEYSGYLTSLYGYKNPEEYRDSVTFVKKWNNALSRYVKAELGQTTPTGKPINITPGNRDTRAEIEKAGFDFGELMQAKIAAGELEEEEIDF